MKHFKYKFSFLLCVDSLTGHEMFIVVDSLISHTFLTDNHVRLHSSQNASYIGDVPYILPYKPISHISRPPNLAL